MHEVGMPRSDQIRTESKLSTVVSILATLGISFSHHAITIVIIASM